MNNESTTDHQHVQEIVARQGGLPLLAEMYDRLTEVLRSRPAPIVVPSVAGAIEQTYDALSVALDEHRRTSPPRAVAVVVETGETTEVAALRELLEETSLEARIERLLFAVDHDDRHASYFLMTDVTGAPQLSGAEAQEAQEAQETAR